MSSQFRARAFRKSQSKAGFIQLSDALPMDLFSDTAAILTSFETWTATGSELFSFLSCLHTTTLDMPQVDLTKISGGNVFASEA